jgi:hypothetical protein
MIKFIIFKFDINFLILQHGDISILVLSSAKKGRALVEYKSGKAAVSIN